MKWRQTIVRGSIIVYVALFVLTMTLLSAPGTSVPIYIFLSLLSSVSLVFGKTYARVFGVIALTIAVCLAITDYRGGAIRDERMRAVRKQLEAEGKEYLEAMKSTTAASTREAVK
jgi:hypothetical protein